MEWLKDVFYNTNLEVIFKRFSIASNFNIRFLN